MNIHEYQAKELLRSSACGAAGGVADTADEAAAVAEARCGGPVCVVKAQIHAGGRGKGGGVKLGKGGVRVVSRARRGRRQRRCSA